MSNIISVTTIVTILSNCASFHPLPIGNPSKIEVSKVNIRLKNKAIEAEASTTYAQAIKNTAFWSEFYQGRADKFVRNKLVSSDLNQLGATAGFTGGIIKEPNLAIGGAILSSLSDNFKNRYAFAVQNTNYQRAADAMQEMSDLLLIYRKHFPNTYPLSTDQQHKLNGVVRKLQRNLRKLQESVQLASFDFSSLQEQVEKIKDKEDKANALASDKIGVVLYDDTSFKKAKFDELIAKMNLISESLK